MTRYSINFYEENLYEPYSIKFFDDKIDFQFGIKLQTENSNKLLDDFDLNLETFAKSKSGSSSTSLKLIDCRNNIFNGKLKDSHDPIFCPEDKSSIVLEGTSDMETYKSVKVKFSVKQNANYESIKRKYMDQDIFVVILSTNKSIRFERTDNTIEDIVGKVKIIVDMNVRKRFEMLTGITKVTLNNSIWYNWPSEYSFASVVNSMPYHITKDQNSQQNREVLDVELISAMEVTNVDRSFYKIEEFLSDSGGLFSNVILIFYIFLTYFNERQSVYTVLNRVFQYENMVGNAETIKLAKREFFEVPGGKTNEPKNFKLRPKDWIAFNPTKTKHILRNMFCCCRDKRKSTIYAKYDKGEDYLNFYLNVLTYINRMTQISLFTDIILEDHQKQAFKFLSKPSISDYEKRKEKEEIFEFETDMLSKTEFEELKKAIGVMKSEENGINNRLLEMMKKKIETIHQELFIADE